MDWEINKAVDYLQKHAEPHSLGKCAEYTRRAIEAGGVILARHNSAKDYGSSLLRAGFRGYEVLQIGAFVIGDVVIIQGINGHPHGHMAMFDGSQWISDFKQRNLYPGPGYQASKPSYKVYRYGILWDRLETPKGAPAFA